MRNNLKFLGHFVEMVVAMVVGMAAFGPLWTLVWPDLPSSPAAHTMVMATDMAIGMALIGAQPWERTSSRTNQRNGSRPRTLSTTAGDLRDSDPPAAGRGLTRRRRLSGSGDGGAGRQPGSSPGLVCHAGAPADPRP
jgi:hypothetical protein